MDEEAGDITSNFGEGDGGQVMPVIHCAAEAGWAQLINIGPFDIGRYYMPD